MILSLASNSGVPGDVFLVFGLNFDEPGLQATVGGRVPQRVTLRPGAEAIRALEIVAPPCSGPGPAEFVICTDYGCDSELFGFLYEGCGGVGPFIRGDCNQDGDTRGSPTDGIFLLNFLFAGGVVPSCLAACDYNGDGEVDGAPTDALYFFNFNFLGGPPIPGPEECGFSDLPADEVLGCENPSGCS